MSKKYKIAIVITHVIQYMVPLYHKINKHPEIELFIYFFSDFGLSYRKDKGFGIPVTWDNISLDGLNYKFLRNYTIFPSVNTFWGLFNPGIIKEIKNKKFDAIVIPGYYNLSYWLVILACIFYKIPFIITGEPPTPYRSKIKKYIFNQFKRLFLPYFLDKSSAILYIGTRSKWYYLYYKKFVKDIEKKLFFTPYSVDNDYFFNKHLEFKDRKEEIKRKLGLPVNLPVILFLSKLIKWKRPFFLLKAFEKIDREVVLIYVGTGYKEKELKKYVIKKKLKNIYFFGFRNYSEIPKFYSIADIFVFPSLGEAWGLVLNEAMCFGLPIITTDKVSAAVDLVKDNGYIIDSNSLDELISTIRDLLDNPSKRIYMGSRSKDIISSWNYDKYIEGLIASLEFIYKDKNICIPF